MLNVIRTFGERLPAACSNTCPEAWAVFNSFLSKYGTDYPSAERTTRVLRHGLTLFGDAALPVASSVLERMATGFVLTGFSSYLWIAGKLVGRFGRQEDHALRAAFLDVYERSTTKVVALLHQKSPGEIPDGKNSFDAYFQRSEISS
jgi:transportin-3